MGMRGLNLRFQKGDLLAVAAALLLAVAVFFLFLPRESGVPVAEVYLDGELIRQLPLDAPVEFEVNGAYRNTITVQDGKIGVSASDCPGGDCVHSGAIGSTGRSIVCLPNRMEIRIVSAAGDVDFVVG